LVPDGSGEEEAEVERTPEVRDSKTARLRIAGRDSIRENLKVKCEKKPSVKRWNISFIYCLFWCSELGLICMDYIRKVFH
jgi:hypothetical protein